MDTIGGFRLVRKLGDGERAEVFLGHAVKTEGAAGPRTAAIKVYRSSASRSGIDVEIEALARASSRHLLRLEDLATNSDSKPVLVLSRLRSVTLAHLLSERGEFRPGEVVTIVAPIALAIRELHRVGVAHGRIRLSSVLFDESGAPVIAGFGHASLIGPMPDREAMSSLTPAAFTESQAAMRDLADLAALAQTIIAASEHSAPRTHALGWLNRTDSAKSPLRFALDVSDLLFDFASAEPVELLGDPGEQGAASSPRTAAVARDDVRHRDGQFRQAPPSSTVSRRELHRAYSSPRRPDWIAALHLPPWLDGVGAKIDLSRLRSGRHVIAQFLAPVRRPVWIAAGTAALLLTTALAVIPDGGDGGADATGAAVSGASPEADSGKPEAAAPGATAPDATGPDATRPESSEPGTVELGVTDSRAVLGDDPVAAGQALLNLRADCLAQRSVLCLDGVDQTGSAAWEADSYLVRQLQESVPQDASSDSAIEGQYGAVAQAVALTDAAITLIDRMGNSAILELEMSEPMADSTPASLLIVKGEAGWRLRDVMIG